jgi:Fanconi-associated nuclease 1
VFYRSTEWTEKSLTTVILSRTMKRNFPAYVVSRTAGIFPSRDALTSFEASIKLQAEVDQLLESGVPTEDDLQRVLDIFNTTYPLWQRLVAKERATTKSKSDEGALERVYLRRFDAAWVYTRIVHKGMYVLGRFKQYSREHSVLTALLEQPYFQPARRGAWYQRKALIEEKYLPPPQHSDVTLRSFRRKALQTCEAGLQDPQTHVIFHHDLQKRIGKLERQLRVAKREQHTFTHLRLLRPTERTMYGQRLSAPEPGKKSIWRDPAGGSECSVEEMCLSLYRREGWKGYHAEGGVVRTLFALLFYDVLFLYVPNVFQTAFQTSPLDLSTDSFYASRAGEINRRLADISNGAAAEIVERVHRRESGRRTAVVGLDWAFALPDLLEIVRCCWDGGALATVCLVLAQEYRLRAGGMPDLFLWRVNKKGEGGEGGECMFAEGMFLSGEGGREGGRLLTEREKQSRARTTG